jgi:hypothetical protein
MSDSNKSKYSELWERYLPSIIQSLQNCNTDMRHILLNAYEFKLIGNKKNYSFNLEFVDGKVSNNIKSSAEAKDLATVIENSKVACKLIEAGHYKLRMDNKFCLWICRVGNCNELSFDFKDLLLNNF